MTDGTRSTDPANAALFKEKKKKAPAKGKGGAKAKKAAESDSDAEDEGEPEWVHPPPKRALSAWTLFVTAYGAELGRQVPPPAQKERFGLAAAKWAEMTDAEKKPYTDESATLKELEAA
jgi:hypothetical protein